MALAAADLNDSRSRGQMLLQEIAHMGQMAHPAGSLVEHQVRLVGVGHLGIVKASIVDMAAADATDKLQRQTRHLLGLAAAGRPGQGCQRLPIGIEKRHRHMMTAGRAGTLSQRALVLLPRPHGRPRRPHGRQHTSDVGRTFEKSYWHHEKSSATSFSRDAQRSVPWRFARNAKPRSETLTKTYSHYRVRPRHG